MRVQKFVHNSSRERLNRCGLLRAQRSQFGMHAPQFGLSNLFTLLLQSDNGRGHIDRALALMESRDLGGDQGLGVPAWRPRSAM